MLMGNQHLYKSPAIEVYGSCRLLPPWLRVPSWFYFFNPGLKNCWLGWPGIEPITLDLSSQTGAYDVSATATLNGSFSFYISLKSKDNYSLLLKRFIRWLAHYSARPGISLQMSTWNMSLEALLLDLNE